MLAVEIRIDAHGRAQFGKFEHEPRDHPVARSNVQHPLAPSINASAAQQVDQLVQLQQDSAALAGMGRARRWRIPVVGARAGRMEKGEQKIVGNRQFDAVVLHKIADIAHLDSPRNSAP